MTNKFKIIRIRDGALFGVFRREIVQESSNAIYLTQDADFESEGVKTHVITEFDKTKFRLEETDAPVAAAEPVENQLP